MGWAITSAGGLLLRRTLWDRGTATAFVVVTAVVLGMLLVGWRALGRHVRTWCGRGTLSVAAVRGGPLDGGTVINLYVGNLPFSTTSDELATMFGRVGIVTSAQVITDRETGRSRGFGFVEMSDEDARKAIDELTGADLGGRSITVNEARPRQPRTRRWRWRRRRQPPLLTATPAEYLLLSEYVIAPPRARTRLTATADW